MDEDKDTPLVMTVIREITGESDARFASFDATVSAAVGGVDVITDELIRVALVYDGTNYADISVFWEDHGYRNYRQMGLFGIMKTQYQSVIRTGVREIRVVDEKYSVTIRY
ncbi:hypothetical protein [Burkholderia ubonensis]|uniref:hypothetical protein n=1 Tax=Burkholderia ubonensis TaxID=101571 RepID=UPI00075645A7|nr:hypothetical protein [Burkholderia ubonensis]KUZ93883.1 hypothetical protein WI40_19525 [Burkholderia ubonensis]KVA16836.1 hypothetical protein WI42_17295 [Burkholderia ubonensis]KVA20350.1 hypothetical protein WI43_15555 [Burkholderia ubonensis]KVA38251.1 hypothetical protein WI46_17565 [Burkholderia ubonensis]